jgi:hypothetical protein
LGTQRSNFTSQQKKSLTWSFIVPWLGNKYRMLQVYFIPLILTFVALPVLSYASSWVPLSHYHHLHNEPIITSFS